MPPSSRSPRWPPASPKFVLERSDLRTSGRGRFPPPTFDPAGIPGIPRRRWPRARRTRPRSSRREFLAAASGVSGALDRRGASRAVPPPSAAGGGGTAMDIERFVADCVAANREIDAAGGRSRGAREDGRRCCGRPRRPRGTAGSSHPGSPSFEDPDDLQRDLGAEHEPDAARPPHVGGNRHLRRPRGQHPVAGGRRRGSRRPARRPSSRATPSRFAANAIHSGTNPLSRFTGGIHVYGGDFFDTVRSQWNPETLEEEPSDGETIRGIFRRENERMRRCGEP